MSKAENDSSNNTDSWMNPRDSNTEDDGGSGITKGTWGFVRSNRRALESYPREGGFTTLVVSEEGKSIIRTAVKFGIVETVDTVNLRQRGERDFYETTIYQMTEHGRYVMDESRQPEGISMPCGCDVVSFSNVADSPYYQCPECNGRWTEDEVLDQNPQLKEKRS